MGARQHQAAEALQNLRDGQTQDDRDQDGEVTEGIHDDTHCEQGSRLPIQGIGNEVAAAVDAAATSRSNDPLSR